MTKPTYSRVRRDETFPNHPSVQILEEAVEICKTLCGMSIIENIKEYGNCNLVKTKNGAAQKDDDGEAQKDNGETS